MWRQLIAAGEEITSNYGSDGSGSKFGAGAENCRGVIDRRIENQQRSDC
jgi:hypothetical protein